MCIRDSPHTIEMREKEFDISNNAASVNSSPQRGQLLGPVLSKSKGLGIHSAAGQLVAAASQARFASSGDMGSGNYSFCLLYTSDAADDLLCVDLGGRRII
eukprot:TRINITY_DN21646_c0_g1_i1.p1 TRINITY_DN21646_c0_g1~~TRINITY_DN21646_c0_g1_i1.p1  ORF type:complete len:101 (-),score=40.86 TRINITY_DN21646_c0_g1_i1:62-364(-)